MSQAIRLVVFLGAVAAIAAGALAYTYNATKAESKKQEALAKQNAIGKVFFRLDMDNVVVKKVVEGKIIDLNEGGDKEPSYYLIYLKEDDAEPSYFAVQGEGIGYNTGVPIVLLVGFTNPAVKGLPEQGEKDGFVCVGWNVVKSEETPGLGEVAKAEKAPNTIVEIVSGNAKTPEKHADMRTNFQKQFEGKVPAEMKSKETIDVITAATYSTNGIIKAVQDAEANLKKAMPKSASAPDATPAKK